METIIEKTMGRIKKAFKTAGCIVTAAAVLFAAVLMVLFLCGFRFYVVKSGSMEPVISVGSLEIVNKNYEFSELVRGDVICYTASNGALVTHRIETVNENIITTKGDANDVSDGTAVTEENYEGLEIAAIPYIGYAAVAVTGRKGRIIIITIIASLLIISFFPEKKSKI